MKRYLDSRRLGERLADLFKPGEQVDSEDCPYRSQRSNFGNVPSVVPEC